MSASKKRITLFMGGNAGPSMCVDVKENIRDIVDDYIILCFPKDKAMQKIFATPKTEHQFFISHQRNGKVTSVWQYLGEGYALRKKGYTEMCKEFEGILVVLWHCEEELSDYQMLYIDTQNKFNRNLCLSAFGYERDAVRDTVYRILSMPLLEHSEEIVQALDSVKMIPDNLEQMSETTD